MSGYLTHNETLGVINSTMADNYKVLQAIDAYFSDMSNGLEKLVKQLSSLSDIFKTNKQGKPVDYESEFSKYWRGLTETVLNPAICFDEPAKKIRSEVSAVFGNIASDYAKRAGIISQRGVDVMEKLKKSEEERNRTYKIYEKAGNDLKAAFNSKAENLNQLKDEFVKAQTDAIAAHEAANDVRMSASTSIDSILSDFEGLEIYRLESTRRAIISFAKSLQEISQNFTEHSQNIETSLQKANPDVDANSLSLDGLVKDARADERFQIIPIDKHCSKYADLELLFKADLTTGAKLMQAKEDYVGPYNHLDLVSSEVVCLIRTEGDLGWVKDINEGEGYVPLSILADYSI